jgi:uncharacterized heparinase superfamily protein
MQAPGRFRFLNMTAVVSAAADWDDPRQPRLWRYNLHYFDDLNAHGAPQRSDWHRLLIRRWVKENRPGSGTGWEPYPTSLRLVNWIKWGLQGNRLDSEAVESMAVQTRWLRKRLETHLLGNHLWSNAKALIFSGAFFSGPEADEWLSKGSEIVGTQLREQVLADGGHFERSPMYHALCVEDVLDLVNLAATYPGRVGERLLADLHEIAPRMLHWLRVMTHPDGRISFFNDAAFGIAPEHAELEQYARRLGVGTPGVPLDALQALADSGYVRIARGPAVVICDTGPIGPDHLPGHAHADTLSFEMSIREQRLIVNGGTSTYERSPERQRQRGSAAHSTLVLDGRDSSEVWSAFRVGSRARPLDVRCGSSEDCSWVEGSHDGYRRAGRGSIHRRTWRLEPNMLSVTDRVEGQHASAEVVFHLHPAVRVDGVDGGSASLRLGDGAAVSFTVSGGRIVPVKSKWHPEFGLAVDAHTLLVRLDGRSSVTQIAW